MSYCGYLVGNTFMAGQCFGLPVALVKWVAKSAVPQQNFKAGRRFSAGAKMVLTV
jgi:hypothetical protein